MGGDPTGSRNALTLLGERESRTETGCLEKAVAAYSAALEKRTRVLVPLSWAASFGEQGVALMLIADRTSDGALAETAVQQIDAAYETACSGGHHARAIRFKAKLTTAKAIRDRLKGK